MHAKASNSSDIFEFLLAVAFATSYSFFASGDFKDGKVFRLSFLILFTLSSNSFFVKFLSSSS